MGAGISGEALVLIILLSLGIYIGHEAIKGAKWVGHKTKCGVMLIVGKHCEPPADPDKTEPTP